MIARNATSSAATALGYGLAVSRAVARNSAALRAATRREHFAPITNAAESADLRKLAAAGLLVLTEGRVGRARKVIIAFRLTDAGRALAARL